MIDTVAMLQKQIAGYVLMPTDDEVLDCGIQGMRRAVDHLNLHIWNSSVLPQDINFVADENEYYLDAAFKAPFNFEFLDVDNVSRGRFEYKPWKTFLLEHTPQQGINFGGQPVYSVSNASELGTVTIEATPSLEWVNRYPYGRIWYYRNFALPIGGVGLGNPIDVFQQAVAYVQAFAEGYTADRFAQGKAAMAYERAFSLYDHRNHTGALLTFDNTVHTDWQGE